MNWLVTKNLAPNDIDLIPVLEMEVFRNEILDQVKNKKRVVSFFGKENINSVSIICILADDANSKILLSSTKLEKGESYPSLTRSIPSMNLFEREINEDYGIKPEGHPWLKPLRNGIAKDSSQKSNYDFFSMTGDEVHEVGVGPIHAGIIEPGHFRFSCHGENIFNLEIQHGFQRRGIEKLIESKNSSLLRKTKLAESIAGDTVVGHTTAFTNAMEALSEIIVDKQTELFKAIVLELERIANHVGDLSAISQDIGYLTGSSTFGALRTEIINTTMTICGNRFGRNLLRIGSVDISNSNLVINKLKEVLPNFMERVELASNVLFESSSVLSRIEKTGIVDSETAASIGMVGPSARASNLNGDVRADHPFGAYKLFPVHTMKLETGDVFARAYIRYIEIKQSVNIISDLLLSVDDTIPSKKDIKNLTNNSIVVSLVEGWRGEICHVAITNENGEIIRYKIKDPSFNNWTALELAIRNNGISDFPLCNKSFNLSYCGFDL